MGMMYYGMGWYGALLSGLIFIMGSFVFSLVFWLTARRVWDIKGHDYGKSSAKKKK